MPARQHGVIEMWGENRRGHARTIPTRRGGSVKRARKLFDGLGGVANGGSRGAENQTAAPACPALGCSQLRPDQGRPSSASATLLPWTAVKKRLLGGSLVVSPRSESKEARLHAARRGSTVVAGRSTDQPRSPGLCRESRSVDVRGPRVVRGQREPCGAPSRRSWRQGGRVMLRGHAPPALKHLPCRATE